MSVTEGWQDKISSFFVPVILTFDDLDRCDETHSLAAFAGGHENIEPV